MARCFQIICQSTEHIRIFSAVLSYALLAVLLILSSSNRYSNWRGSPVGRRLNQIRVVTKVLTSSMRDMVSIGTESFGL